MAQSEKLIKILLAKTELSEKEISSISEAEGWRMVYGMAKKKDHRPQICFTGFRPEEMNNLIALAENNGLKVVKSVTVGLNYLCCGENAGPSKIEKAKENGVLLISSQELEDSMNNTTREATYIHYPVLTEKKRSFPLFSKRKVNVVFNIFNNTDKIIRHVSGSIIVICDKEELIEMTIDQKYTLEPYQTRPIKLSFPLNVLEKNTQAEIINNIDILKFRWETNNSMECN